MATTEEMIKLILSVSGQDAIDDMNQSLGYTQASLEQLKNAYQRGEISTDEFMKTARQLTSQEAALKRSIDEATAAMNHQAAAATAVAGVSDTIEDMGVKGGMSAHKLMQLGNTLDDLQYVGEMGLRPIINNVMQIDAKLGMALIAFEMLRKGIGDKLIKAFEDFFGAIQKSETSVDSLKKKIEDLEKKPVKLSVDLAELDAAKKKLDEIEKQKAALDSTKTSSAERTLGGLASSIITDYAGGSGNLTGIVEGIDRQTGVNRATTEQAAAMDKLKYQLTHQPRDSRTGAVIGDPEAYQEMIQKRITELQSQIDQEYTKYAKQEVAKFAQGDPAAIAAMKNRIGKAPGAFEQKGLDGLTLADAIGMMPATPDEYVAQKQQAELHAKNTKEATEAAQKRTVEAEKRKQEIAQAQAKGRAETNAEEDEINSFLDSQDREAKAKAEKHKRDLDRSREERKRIKDKEFFERGKEIAKLAELDRQEAADPFGAARDRLIPGATQNLRQAGLNDAAANAYAPQLAEALLNGANAQIATQTIVANAIGMMRAAAERQRQADAMLRMNAANMQRMRQVNFTTQPPPFFP